MVYKEDRTEMKLNPRPLQFTGTPGRRAHLFNGDKAAECNILPSLLSPNSPDRFAAAAAEAQKGEICQHSRANERTNERTNGAAERERVRVSKRVRERALNRRLARKK